jgi:1-acyl-sn-glycerol-3-phosphate acyltransferase
MRVVSRNYYANIGKVMEFPEALEVAKVDRVAAREMILRELRKTIDSLIVEIKTDKFWS